MPKLAFEVGTFLAIQQQETPNFAIVQVNEPVALNMETFKVKKLIPKTKTQLATCSKYEIPNEEIEISDQKVLCEVEVRVVKQTQANVTKQQLAKIHKYLNSRKSNLNINENEDFSDKEEEQNAEDYQLPKARKADKGSKKQAEKTAKTENENYKKGKFNKDVNFTEVKYDQIISDSSQNLKSECCVTCANKNVIRAVINNNADLLEQIMKSDKKVSSLVQKQSIHNKNTAFSIACVNGEKAIIQKFLDHLKEQNDTQNKAQIKDKMKFAKPQNDYPLSYVESGQVSRHTFGTYVRRVQMTRGNKQGNNAFLLEQCDSDTVENLIESEEFVRYLMLKGVKTDILDQLAAANEEFLNLVGNHIVHAVRAGHRKLAGYCIQIFESRGGSGFNFLHKEALMNEDQDFTEFKKVSIKKVPLENLRVTPIHCACINPNVKYLQTLYEQLEDKQIMDSQWRKLVHYAAACEGTGPLNFLIEKGHDITVQDERKITPLMIACMANRPENVKILLAKEKQNLTLKTKRGWTAIHYAAWLGSIECLKEIQNFIDKKNEEFNIQGPEKMTPLAVASAYGQLEIVQ